MRCGFCNAENPEGSTSCSVCMREFDAAVRTPHEKFRRTSELSPRGESVMPRSRSQTTIIAGAILIVNGLMGIGSLLLVNLYVSVVIPQYATKFAFYSAVVGGLSIFVLLGGAITMTRKAWGLCLAASISGVILSLLGVFCGVVGLMVSITGVILIFFARKEFE